MSDADITIPSLYKLGRPPSQEISQELIARIRQLEVSKSLDLSDETIERIANELYFYRNMREATPEWKKAQQTSLKDLSAASKAALQMVEVIRENILRVDNASMYHQDVVERYAASMELRRQDLP